MAASLPGARREVSRIAVALDLDPSSSSRAAFEVTIHGFRSTYRLVYTEVYARKNGRWSLVNIHTCSDSG